MQKNKGFTLIELLVVIAIIGILSSVVLASLNTAREKARDTQRISDIRQIQLALEFYFDDNSRYPTDAEGLAALSPTFLPATPVPPAGGVLVAYAYNAENVASPADYCLGIDLEGGAGVVPGNDTECDAEEGTDTTGIAWATAGDPAGEYSVNP